MMEETTNLTEIAMKWYCKRHPEYSLKNLRNTTAEIQLRDKFFNQLHLCVIHDSWDEYLADLDFDRIKVDKLEVNFPDTVEVS